MGQNTEHFTVIFFRKMFLLSLPFFVAAVLGLPVGVLDEKDPQGICDTVKQVLLLVQTFSLVIILQLNLNTTMTFSMLATSN